MAKGVEHTAKAGRSQVQIQTRSRSPTAGWRAVLSQPLRDVAKTTRVTQHSMKQELGQTFNIGTQTWGLTIWAGAPRLPYRLRFLILFQYKLESAISVSLSILLLVCTQAWGKGERKVWATPEFCRPSYVYCSLTVEQSFICK